MITNINNLESGKEYTLNQLFNGKIRIVIPDLQRDYCWGDKAWNKDANNYSELVSGFIDNLVASFKENPNNKLTLGLIYGYENPHFTIQLCDGQQRLTTLFLLVGMINRRTENNSFKDRLISEAELADDKETNLQYAIRESTLYFLSDLVCEFFLKNKVSIDDIKMQDWYFNEYNLDASIQSMICAINTIEKKLVNIDCNDFGEFVIKNLQMIYYDMGHRTRGEETFVIINTTGEPLTATENLKPILIGTIEDLENRKISSDEWEYREEWFWKNRRGNEQTADDASKDFYIWYWQIRLLQEKSWKGGKSYQLNPNELFQKEPIVTDDQEERMDIERWSKSKDLKTVHKYFSALEKLIEICEDEKIVSILKTIDDNKITLTWFRDISLDVVLPMIAYIEKFTNHQNFYKFVRRIRKNYFDKQWSDRNKNYIDWRHIIQIIEFSDNEEGVFKFETTSRVGDFKKIANVKLNEWYNEDEKLKDILKKDHIAEIENWEDHDELYGDLSIIWKANKNDIHDYESISQSYQSFKTLSDCFVEEKTKTNPVLSNYFRLYKLLIGYPPIGHIDYCSWDIEGAWFSWRNTKSNDFFKYLSDERIVSLIKVPIPNLEKELENKIRLIVNETSLLDVNEDNFSASKHLKAWFTIKVLYANSKNKLLSFHDDNGIATYKDVKRNKLNVNIEFSLANSICGYAIKNPANRIDYFRNKTNCIDTPIGEHVSYEVFNNREKDFIPEEQILSIAKEIDVLVKTFLLID